MSGADRQSQPAPPSADQLRMFLQSMQQIQPNNTVTPKPGNTASDKQSPSLEDNKVFEMLINNPEYQRMINYSQMSQAAAQSVPIQHPLSAAASNPDNPAFRALMNGTNMPGFSHEIYPNFVPEMHPGILAANQYYANGMPFAPYMGGIDAGRRKNATREVTMPLKKWLSDHRKYPYPNKAEKLLLAIITKMSLTQVSTWFANARRRLKKENKMTWSPRCRPGDEEEDDDDLGDAVDNEPPSPSISINSSDEFRRDSTNNVPESKTVKREHPENSSEEAPTPKRKVLSVSDMLSTSDQSPSRRVADKSPRSTTPPSSSSNGTVPDATPNVLPGMPQMGQFVPGQTFPFPFMSGARHDWNPQMMAMLAGNAAARNPLPFGTIPPMNPNFLPQMFAMQQMSNFMRSGPAMPPLNPAMLAAMQGFFPSTSAAPANSPTTKTASVSTNKSASTKASEQPQSPSAVNTSSSSISETNAVNEIPGTDLAKSTDETAHSKEKSTEEEMNESPQPQSKPVAAH